MASRIQRNPIPATAFRIAFLCSCFASIALLGRVCSAFSSQTRCSFPITTATSSRTNEESSTIPNTELWMSSFMDRGWDNDNFLESLGGGSNGNAGDGSGGNEALDRANDEYFRQSRYGRPAAVDHDDEESRGPSSSSPPKTKLGYKESLRRKQEQRRQQQQSSSVPPDACLPQTNNTNDMAAVSDAAAEIYSYSYNKEVDAPPPALGVPSSPTATTSNSADNDDGETIESTEEATLPKEMVDKVRAANENPKEEASQGGSKFGDLMDRAREQQKRQQQKPKPQQQVEVQRRQTEVSVAPPVPTSNGVMNANTDAIVDELAIEDLRGLTKRLLQIAKDQNDERMLSELKPFIRVEEITPPSKLMTPEEIATLSLEEQARLYREFFYVQQKQAMAGKEQQPQQQTLPSASSPKSIGSTPSNYLEPGIGFDGRKIGRNKDADSISNASDVYFAQLKRDSTTRNLARYSGDDTKANDVFHDPSIQDIKAPVNPYLEEERKRMRDVVETVPEEMLVFADYNAPEGQLTKEEMESFSGISYKEKLLQKKREREEQRKRQQPSDNNNTGSNGHSY